MGVYTCTSQLSLGRREWIYFERDWPLFSEQLWSDKWLCKTLPHFTCAPCLPGSWECQALNSRVTYHTLFNHFVYLSDPHLCKI